MKTKWDEQDVETTKAYDDALITVMREMCAMMRKTEGMFPECWQAGRANIVELAHPVFEYGPADYFTDGLGDFAVVVREPEPVKAPEPMKRLKHITRHEAWKASRKKSKQS